MGTHRATTEGIRVYEMGMDASAAQVLSDHYPRSRWDFLPHRLSRGRSLPLEIPQVIHSRLRTAARRKRSEVLRRLYLGEIGRQMANQVMGPYNQAKDLPDRVSHLGSIVKVHKFTSTRWYWGKLTLVHYHFGWWKFGACYFPKRNTRGFHLGMWRFCWSDRSYKQIQPKEHNDQISNPN